MNRMRRAICPRLIASLILLPLTLTSFGCQASTPEVEWESFVTAVEEHRGADAADHVDFERLIMPNPEDKAGLGEISDEMVDIAQQGLIDLHFDKGQVPIGPWGTEASIVRRPTRVTINGNTAELTFELEELTAVVQMEKLRGEWMIVGF